MTVSTIHMLMSGVRAGVGIGLVPDIFLTHEPGTENLVSVPINNAILNSFSVHGITRLGRTIPKSAQVFLDLLASALRDQRSVSSMPIEGEDWRRRFE